MPQCTTARAAPTRARARRVATTRELALLARHITRAAASFGFSEAAAPRRRIRARIAGCRAVAMHSMGVLLFAACTGSVGDAPGSPAESHVVAPTESVAPVPLRRLTRVEYTNAIRDLTGVGDGWGELPDDTAVSGFAANSFGVVTQVGAERYAGAAFAIAERVDLARVLPCDPAAIGEDACATELIGRFGRRAFRRPLDAGEIAALQALYDRKRIESDFESAVRLLLEAILQAPSFLYRVEERTSPNGAPAPLGGFELATRLSFFLWASVPDDALLDAAAGGRLATLEGLDAEARRMLDDPRALDAVESFHLQWLGVADLDHLDKDAGLYPEATPTLGAEMRLETATFVRHVFGEAGASLRALLTAEYTFAGPELASLYGVVPAEGPLALPAGQRSGVLTHAGFLATRALPNQPSPILRGRFVRERLLCEPIAPPPPDVDVTPPAIEPGVSARDRFEAHTSDPLCATCHVKMDPIGFGFGHYDAIGRFVAEDGGAPVDARGEILEAPGDVAGEFDGVPALAERLLASETLSTCLSRQWLRFALGRGEQPGERGSVESARAAFEAHGDDLRELMLGVVRSDAFRTTRRE
jgi:hypothetical protein